MALHGEPPDPIATYRERFAHLRRDFRLYDRQIVVSGTIARNAFETTLPLGQIAPEFGIIWLRSNRFIYGISLFSVCAIFAAMLSSAPDGSPAKFIRIGAAILALWGLLWSLSYFPKRAAYRFINDGGILVLDFVASGPDRENARQFAETVAKAIRECKAHTQ